MRTFITMLLISGGILYVQTNFVDAKVRVDPCQKQTAPGKAQLHPTPAANLMMACAIDQWEIQKVIGGTRQVISYLRCRNRDGDISLFHRVPDHSTSGNSKRAIDSSTSGELVQLPEAKPVEDEEPHR